MRDHLISLFDRFHKALTIRYLIISIALIVTSQIAGIKENLFGISSLVSGLCCLCYSFVHPWKDGRKYALLAWICAGLLTLTFAVICILSWLGFDRSFSEAVIMFGIFLICLPGIIVGILGAVIYD